MKKVLILSCNTGQGHNSCAQAMEEYLGQRGVDYETIDALALISPGVSGFISWGHSVMYRHIPGLFRWGYHWAEKHPGMFSKKSPAYKLLVKGADALYERIHFGGYDTVICTHIFPAIMLTDMMKKTPLPVRTALLATDYTCSPGVDATDMQWYFIPHPSLKKDFIAAGIPEERIVASGIPVRREFYKSTDKADAKRLLNIHPGHKHVLIACGSMGCDSMKKVLRRLVKVMPADMEVSVICGSNTVLARKLRLKYRHKPRVHIQGYTGEMSLYMDSADLYVTKPGGITVTEAAVKNTPMVLIDAVSGCEGYNLRFFTRSCAAFTASTPEKLAYKCVALSRSDNDIRRMRTVLQSYRSISDMGRIWTALGGAEKA